MNEQEFQLKKYQSESDQDFVARLILELLNLKKASNSHLGAVNQEDKARHEEMVQHSLANLGQGEEAQKILEEIKRVIEEKDIDLSEVVSGLKDVDSSIQKGSSGVNEKLDNLPFEIPETKTILQEIAQSVKENKPNDVVFDSVIDAQKKSTSILGELLSKLTGELKKKEYPKAMSIDGPVDVLKPKWWKEFSFSWAPLEKLFEKLKAHTFSVKVENQQGEQKLIDSDEIAQKISKELAKVIKSIPRGGSMGNPFAFSTDGKLITTNSDYIFSSILDGRKVVTTAGTAVQLATDTPVSKVIITGMINNTDYVVVGGSTVVALEATRRGIPIMAGQSMEMSINNLNKIYLDAVVSGEGVTFVYF